MDNCCFDRCLNDSYHAVEVDSEVFKTAFKNFKVFTGLRLHHLITSTGGRVAGWVDGRVGGLSETGNKAQPQLKLKLS